MESRIALNKVAAQLKESPHVSEVLIFTYADIFYRRDVLKSQSDGAYIITHSAGLVAARYLTNINGMVMVAPILPIKINRLLLRILYKTSIHLWNLLIFRHPKSALIVIASNLLQLIANPIKNLRPSLHYQINKVDFVDVIQKNSYITHNQNISVLGFKNDEIFKIDDSLIGRLEDSNIKLKIIDGYHDDLFIRSGIVVNECMNLLGAK